MEDEVIRASRPRRIFLILLLVLLLFVSNGSSQPDSLMPVAANDSMMRVSDVLGEAVLPPETPFLLNEYPADSPEGFESPTVDGFITHELESLPFGVGERLRYHLDFSFVQAGLSEMAIVAIDTTTGRPSFHFRSRARSTRTIDLLFKVRDTVESWFDTKALYSHRYERRIREGGYKSLKFFDYDHRTGWASISNENGPKGVTPFEPFSHNIISALYWVRTQPLEEGVDLHLPLHDLEVQYPLTVKVYGREKVSVPAGEWECWKVEPVIESEGLFQMTGRLVVWLSDDSLRLPVKMSSTISVGSIQGVLVDYRLGKDYQPGEAPDLRGETDWDW